MKNTYKEVVANLVSVEEMAARVAGLLPLNNHIAQHSVGIRVRKALEELEEALERLEIDLDSK